jgi:hypothetical protein
MSRRDDPPPPERLPADVGRPDTILFGLTARQVGILAATGLLLWTLWATTTTVLAAPVFLAIAAPVGLVGFMLAVGRRDGISLDRWLYAAWRHRRSPHLLVDADGPVPAPPRWVATTGVTAVPAPLRLPARGITGDGLVDLGPDGTAGVVSCATVNFHLRSGTEQRGLVAGYARWLNSLDAPVQVLIRSRRVDLTGMATQIIADAGGLPDPALEEAARDHAAFVQQLAAQRQLLHRDVFVIVRDRRSPLHTRHRADETVRALAACEVTAHVCDGPQTASVLAECAGATPPPLGRAAADSVITATPGRTRR